MTCYVTVVINWGGGFQMFFNPLSKCPCWLSYVLFIAFQAVTFESVDYTTLFCYVVFIFRCHQLIFYGLSTSEVYLYAISLAYVLNALTQAFHVRYCNVTSIDDVWLGIFVVVVVVVVVVVAAAAVFGFHRSTGLQLHPVYSPSRILARWQQPMNVCVCVLLLVVLGCNIYIWPCVIVSWWHCTVPAVPLQVLIGVIGLPVNSGWQTFIILRYYQSVQQGIAPSMLVVSAVNFVLSSIELMWWKNSFL